MLSIDKLIKEIENITLLIAEVELAVALEENEKTKNDLRSAAGQLKAARTWLVKIQRNGVWT